MHSVILFQAIWLVHYLGVGVIECYSVPDDLTMVDLQKKNLHFKMSIKLNLNNFLLQNFMLRLSVDEITFWVCTKTIFIVILFSLCE